MIRFKAGLKSIAMKTILILILAAVLSLTLEEPNVCSQTIAIGHVTAEVIESVSAASVAVTSFELEAIEESDNRTFGPSILTSENISLGVITLHSGKNISCNVVVKPASLSDAAGNGFMLKPTVKNNSYASAAKADGSQTIHLDGKSNRSSSQASGLYKGSYTVVFAFN